MKKRGFMSWFSKNHPLTSNIPTIRYLWLIATLPIQILAFPVMAFFAASIEFARSFSGDICDWIEMFAREWRRAGKCKNHD